MANTRTSLRGKRKISYNEDALAKKFDITGKEQDRGKAVKKGMKSSGTTTKEQVEKGGEKKRLITTAERELTAAGKTGYRGGATNKPAPQAEVLEGKQPLPTRNQHCELVFKDHPEFRPNLTPQEMFELGSFGGSYFRPIVSAVTMQGYKNMHEEYPKEWWENVKVAKEVKSVAYDETVNKYGLKCGGSLDMWESSGWISPIDPYGWFMWYCRFYLGRRSTDDDRQIGRGNKLMGPTGRFRNSLIGKCARGGKPYNDYSVSPVIRQTLQHWAYRLTERDANAYVKKKRLPKLPKPLKLKE